ncbi:hypothetical protein AC84_1560 [Escherichia coli 1-392-07_S4_C1]|uniref:hypothetical protein n=1 Tax=Escherichia coli TaxID=562 RepID=UPI0004DAA41D|nr:hypothetical protein [Escherichia coli]KEN71109.1 hypothetical protein AD40_1630 [Escherichia coli 1-392-07_S4_C3]KEO02296.1 hypothetical protein AC84_1560 [Escherichia coli 1-392-07_S4_C1]
MIEDGIYLHKLFDIAYLVKGDKVMIQNPEKPYWESSEMDRWHMQMLLDNGLIYRKQ